MLTPAEIDQIPDHPAVFLLWASQGNPYLARTSALKRRLTRLFSSQGRLSKLLNLNGVADRIEYWPTGSQLLSRGRLSSGAATMTKIRLKVYRTNNFTLSAKLARTAMPRAF